MKLNDNITKLEILQLGSISVGAAVSHRENASTQMRQSRMELIYKFSPEVRLSTSSCSVRITSLNLHIITFLYKYHEILDEPMKLSPFVIPIFA